MWLSLCLSCLGLFRFLNLYTSISSNLETFNNFKNKWFLWNTFRFTNTSCKYRVEFPYTHHPVSHIVNILNIMVYLFIYKSNVGALALTTGFALMFFFSCFRMHSRIPLNILSPYPCISSSLLQFYRFYLLFMALALLKSTGQIFCRMSLNADLSNVFSCLEWGYGFGEKYDCGKVPFSLNHIRG